MLRFAIAAQVVFKDEKVYCSTSMTKSIKNKRAIFCICLKKKDYKYFIYQLGIFFASFTGSVFACQTFAI